MNFSLVVVELSAILGKNSMYVCILKIGHTILQKNREIFLNKNIFQRKK